MLQAPPRVLLPPHSQHLGLPCFGARPGLGLNLCSWFPYPVVCVFSQRAERGHCPAGEFIGEPTQCCKIPWAKRVQTGCTPGSQSLGQAH